MDICSLPVQPACAFLRQRILGVIALATLAGWTGPAGATILLPPTLEGPTYQLTLQTGSWQFRPGTDSATMGVNGPVLGPTLIMEQGEDVSLFLENQLGTTTTIHWHGMHVSPENDGGPHTVIVPGATWNPQFTVLDKAGTYWYHPHLHENTNLHASRGIAGFVIVRDAEEAALDLPRTYGVDDFPLAIQTKTVDETGQIIVPSNADSVLMVNATVNAELAVPGQVVRLRLLNGSSMRTFNLGLEDNSNFQMIASDGGLLGSPLALTRLQLSPGERAEILVNFANYTGSLALMSYASELPNGVYGALQPGMMPQQVLTGYNPNPMNGTDFQVMRFNIGAQSENPVLTIPGELVPQTPLPESQADTLRQFLLTPMTPGPNALNGHFLINGSEFDMGMINETIMLGATEIWSITNQSPIAHPFHIHDVQFYVLDLNGAPPLPALSGRKDVILVPPMQTVRFITQFLDHASSTVPYMYHCHMLIHEDAGMMGQFLVIDPSASLAPQAGLPGSLILQPAFPNPFNPDTVLGVVVSHAQHASLGIFNLLGQEVARLHEGLMGTGEHSFRLDGSTLASGVYIVRLQGDSELLQQKVLLCK
ncbi:MAG: multicopper oxidase domain-containing protein [Candidatus Delongbacteria bacterium]|nr:multicopper oxidase domain-containing protein [Candidatus Delongbacteria bacterium]